MDFSETVGKSEYSVAWVIEMLKESDEKFNKLSKNGIVKVEQKNLSGIGYMSFIIRLSFYFAINENDNDEPFNVICKIPTTQMVYKNFKTSDKNGTQCNNNSHSGRFEAFIEKAHNRECFVYSSFVSKLEINTPKIYFVEEKDDFKEGCILMSDISNDGVLHNILKEMNYQKIETVIKCTAEMHAKSQTLSKEIFENLKFDNCIEVPKDPLNALLKIDSKIIQKYKLELNELWSQPQIVDSHLKYGLSPVVSHGDFWANNIFFLKNEDGKASDTVYTFLDWQLTSRGNGLNDLARFLCISVEADLFQKHRNDFLQIYLHNFNSKSNELGLFNVYTSQLVQEMFHEQSKSELSFSLTILFNFYAHTKDKETKERILKRIEGIVDYCFSSNESQQRNN